MQRMMRRKKRKKEKDSIKRMGRIPVAPSTRKHKDESKCSSKKKRKESPMNDE